MEHKTAFITGASSGLGEGVARRLVGRGTTVYAAARRKEKLEALRTDLGEKLVPVVLDVNDTDAVVETLRRIDGECGGLDLVIANAGIGGSRRAHKLTWEEWVQPTLQTNVMGAFATLTAVLPQMVERGRGHLVGVSSIASVRGLPTGGAYSASKAALSTFLETLRTGLKKSGITVTTIEPGFVKTPLTEGHQRSMPFILELDEAVDQIMKAIERGSARRVFPWPIATVGAISKIVPRPLYDLFVS